MLLAVVALVISRSLTATAGLALPAIAAHVVADCPSHAVAAHPAGHHHHIEHLHPAATHAEPEQGGLEPQPVDPQSRDLPAHPEHMACCVTAAALVMPAIGGVPMPSAAGASDFVQAPARALEGRTPEGPAEPPRTSDQD